MFQKHNTLTGLLDVLWLLSASGCTTMYAPEMPLQGVTPEFVRSRLKVGDVIDVYTTTRDSVGLKVTSLGPESLTGVDSSRSARSIQYASIVSFKVRKFSKARTAALAAAGVGSVLLISAVLSEIVYFPVYAGY